MYAEDMQAKDNLSDIRISFKNKRQITVRIGEIQLGSRILLIKN